MSSRMSRLYASPINFDPQSPFFPISDPPEYAGELARRIGLYYTTGMVEDHAGLNNERISEETFLDQCKIVWSEREAMMLHELKSFESGLFYCCLTLPTGFSISSGGSASPITRPTAASHPTPFRRSHRRLLIADATRSLARPRIQPTTRRCSSHFPIMGSTVSSAAFT